MKNGIIINGVAYQAKKRFIDIHDTTPQCDLCALKRRCSIKWVPICQTFEDSKYEVYFEKKQD